MYLAQSLRHGLRRGSSLQPSRDLRRGVATLTAADVEQAKRYCVNQLKQFSYESYLVRHFVPPRAQDAYDALRTLNLELARLPETVSNPSIGRFRMQFWRETIEKVFAGNPPKEPVSILLHKAITDLKARSGGSAANSLKFWALRLINTREQYMDNRPFTSLAALEEYAENTYSSLMYMTLAAMPLRSVHVDHLASHIGKACGIAAVLRGVPVLAARAQPNPTNPSGTPLERISTPALLLPLDIMAEVGLREEDVFRKGPSAEGLQDAIFNVATRAHDHILTARELLKNLQAGEDPGHEFEHEGELEHVYSSSSDQDAAADIQRGFGVLLEAVPTASYLNNLGQVDFDPFKVKRSWKLPWDMYQATRKREI
ncbi:hypothetical protein GQ53DRAFT_849291 [Thozetella sp. PMI_491]|nr:hypothetical protein GQ53DRAFT_849291 [Thozetella sp. PMI_491]